MFLALGGICLVIALVITNLRINRIVEKMENTYLR